MRNAGLIAFGVTTCVLVPAALHRLSAGKAQIEKLAAPSQDTIQIGRATVKASLDRFVLDPGEKLTVKLEATGVVGKRMEVGVLVLGSNGSEGDRVPSPPNRVAYKSLTFDAKDGVATTEMSVALAGARQNGWIPFGHYTVVVGEPKAIARLERLRSRSGYLDTDDEIPSLNKAGSTFMGLYRGWSIAEDDTTSPYAPGRIARLEAHVRPKSDAVALAVPDTASVAHPFTVSVTVKNPGKRALKGLEVSLAEQANFSIDYMEPPPARVHVEPETRTIDLAGHESRTLQFTVTPDRTGVVGLYAHAACTHGDDPADSCRDVQALQLGTFDATEILPADDKAPSVVVR